MGYGVFMHRADSIYDDHPAERYQFPSSYLTRAEPCVGDWVIYLEPVKVRLSRGYFAVARVQRIIPDPNAPGMYLALIEPGSYLPFVNGVPFSGPGGVVERGLLNEKGGLSGRAQAAVRPLSWQDFNRIIALGLPDDAADLPRVDLPARRMELAETQAPFDFDEGARDRATVLVSRVLRDRVFRRIVLSAYDSRCAITGLKLINGGGRAEVEAAHIWPVEKNGPDIVNNGLALSGTAHWMFDRGLISVADNHDILVSSRINDPDSVHAMLNRTGRIIPPLLQRDYPHPRFLKWHRENCFKV